MEARRFRAVMIVPLLAAMVLVVVVFIQAMSPEAATAEGQTAVMVAGGLVAVAALLVLSAVSGIRRVAVETATDVDVIDGDAVLAPPVGSPVDPLTGLADRSAFLSTVERTAGTFGTAWLAIVHVDRLSAVNDAFGRSAGDSLLRHAADVIVELAPEQSLIARVASDRFGVLAPGADEHGVDLVLADLCERLRTVAVEGRLIDVGCNVGVTRVDGVPADGERLDVAQLVAEAEIAMERARRAGRGRVLHTGEATRRALAHLRQGTLGSVVEVSVRLQRSMVDRAIVGARVTVQVDESSSEPVDAADLQFLAEFCRRPYAVLDATLDAIADSSRRVPPAGLRTWFGVSAADLVADPTVGGGAEALWVRLADFGLSWTPFGIELTGAEACDQDALVAAVAYLRSHGVEVAVPVTGRSALRLADAARLGSVRLVLDAGVAEAAHRGDEEMAGVVRAAAELASGLGGEVVALDVNSIDAAQRLAALGVAVAQVSRPEPWAAPRSISSR